MFGAVYTLRPTCFFFELLVINKTRMISLLRSATVSSILQTHIRCFVDVGCA